MPLMVLPTRLAVIVPLPSWMTRMPLPAVPLVMVLVSIVASIVEVSKPITLMTSVPLLVRPIRLWTRAMR